MWHRKAGMGDSAGRSGVPYHAFDFKYEKLFRRKIYKKGLRIGPISIFSSLLVQTKLSKSLTLDNGTDYGDLAFHAAHAITVDGCIGLM